MDIKDLRKLCRDNGIEKWPYSYKRRNKVERNTMFSSFSLVPTDPQECQVNENPYSPVKFTSLTGEYRTTINPLNQQMEMFRCLPEDQFVVIGQQPVYGGVTLPSILDFPRGIEKQRKTHQESRYHEDIVNFVDKKLKIENILN